MLFAAMGAITGFTACDDTVSPIGSSLTGDNVEIVIDSAFSISGHSVRVEAISPKTTDQLIGSIDIPAYGKLSSEFVAQFLPSTELDTADFTAANVDSLVLTLRYARGAFIGDSVAPMGLTVYPLTKVLPTDISSDFDPAGYYSTTPLGSKIYNTSTFNESDTAKAQSYRDINITFPKELGQRLFKAFEDNGANYANGRVFAQNVFPGISVQSTYGNGRLTLVSLCAMSMYMRKIYYNEEDEKLDTLDAQHLYYRVTPEVISNNTLHYTMSQTLSDMLDAGHTMLIAPTGSEVQLTFPAKEIISRYKHDTDGRAVINGLSLKLPVDSIENGHNIMPPPYALLVLSKDRDEFFAKNKLTDDLTSFYAEYDESTGCYTFSSMRAYIMDLMSREEEITADDYTFSLVPVQVNFEELASSSSSYYYYGYSTSTATTESEITPYLIAPAMCDVRLDDAKIIFTYSLQTQK